MSDPLSHDGMRGSFAGVIEIHGTCGDRRGWVALGWLGSPWKEVAHQASLDVSIDTDSMSFPASSIPAMFDRDDIRQQGIGLILFVPGIHAVPGTLVSVSINFGTTLVRLRLLNGAAASDAAAMTARVSALLPDAMPPQNREAIQAYLEAARGVRVPRAAPLAGLDEAIWCEPGLLLISGWVLTDGVSTVRVWQAGQAIDVDKARLVAVARRDVIDLVGRGMGYEDPVCGFLFYAEIGNDTAVAELEIGFEDGREFRQALAVSPLRGLAAIRHVLRMDLAYLPRLEQAFDTALGPAVTALQNARRLRPVVTNRLVFGEAPNAPLCAVIIPLFGRIDLLEVQLGLFSGDAELAGCELIYVLDDPARRVEAAELARSVHTRLAMPFRLLMLDRNLGFATASNVGLAEASAGFVCFLNSDVFPEQAGWLGRLIQRLRKDAKLGVVGPRLVYDDGSIQHEGMVYEAQAEIGGWMFPRHINKGRRPAASSGLRRVEAITGACMVMRRKLATAMGGFDEGFVIGDFEDSDLCRRLAAGGFGCAVDTDVQLVHLERQSQGLEDAVFRRNLTAYNAWVHQRRWFA